jgi:hypothetical protein
MGRFIRLLLAVWITVGLLAAPFAVPASAMNIALPLASAHTMDMSADKPCCPDEKKSSDCADCPFMALCALSIVFVAPSGDASSALRQPLRSVLVASDDLHLQGLGARPPDHPPRLTV